MKIIQWILIALIFLSPYKANASRDTDSYDGNIFPIYAGNGAIVPPQTTLQESLKNKRVSVLFFYLDDRPGNNLYMISNDVCNADIPDEVK